VRGGPGDWRRGDERIGHGRESPGPNHANAIGTQLRVIYP
jgi:hypothetical protein